MAPIDSGPFEPWMNWMRQHIGEVQQTGSVPTAFTEEVFKYTNFGPLNGHTPESCAATVCAALEETGYQSTRSAAAFSYHDYGEACELKPGCIVVYQWKPSIQHHVNFCDKIIDDQTIIGLGGNQSHGLNDAQFLRKFIVATRWPVPKPGAVEVPLAAGLEGVGGLADGGAAALPTFTVHTGQRYSATVTLFGLEQLASNDMIVARLQAVGFQNVQVTGSGATRQAEGTWTGATATGQMDAHLSNVKPIG